MRTDTTTSQGITIVECNLMEINILRVPTQTKTACDEAVRLFVLILVSVLGSAQRGMRGALTSQREVPPAMHVVDVAPDGVQRDAGRRVVGYHSRQLIDGLVAPPAREG